MAHILVVDDDEIFRNYLSAILQLAGHTVMEADNGQTGLQKISNSTVDLIITDIFMPKMDGIDLLAALFNLHPDSKVIAISGGSQTTHPSTLLEMAKNFGAVDVISKPFQMATVIKKVTRALTQQTAKI